MQPGVHARILEKFKMRTNLRDSSALENDQPIRPPERA
jgi:hypothetical protein